MYRYRKKPTRAWQAGGQEHVIHTRRLGFQADLQNTVLVPCPQRPALLGQPGLRSKDVENGHDFKISGAHCVLCTACRLPVAV